ncbi:hypothetical protein, partial [Piscinibacter sp.]|uniref:hypothetical protein n=1 Tax=Piscinibacter sp. TaxID=1903157 RepID=UPI002BB611CC
PLSTNSHAQAPDTSTPARLRAVGVENAIRHKPIETGALISPAGTEIARRTGHGNRVSFPTYELLQASGATFTHNHPGGTGPSVEDLKLALEFQFHEVRVVTSRHRYMVWPLDRTQVFDVQAEYDAEAAHVEPRLRDEVRCNQVRWNDFGEQLVHRVWQRMANRLGFHYRREES